MKWFIFGYLRRPDFYNKDPEFCDLFFQRAKSLKQKKEEGNAAFKACNWSSAHELYTQALEIDPCNKATNAKLYFNRATVAAKVRLFRTYVSYELLKGIHQ